jgi:hypothetical protein
MANINTDNPKEYVSEDGYYIIPVTWEMYSTVKVQGKNLQDAIDRLNRVAEEIPLDDNAEYVDSSYRIEDDSDEHMIAAQNYKHIGVHTVEENDKIY